MPKIQKSLQDNLSKIKPLSPHVHLPSVNSLSSSKNWVMNGCKHSKTLSFAVDHKHDVNGGSNSNYDNGDASATLSDVDVFPIENFKSLYLRDDADDRNHKRVSEENQETPKLISPILFGSPRFLNPPPDLCSSSRFFVAPSFSSSLIEEARTSVTTTTIASDEARSSSSTSMSSSSTLINDHYGCSNSHDQVKEHVNHRPLLREDCIAVCTYSPSPYEDFRRSMQEMVEARLRNNERVDWDFMEELLFCYLNLNEKESYKFILNAFVDSVLVLRQNPESGGSARKVSRMKISTRERRKKNRDAKETFDRNDVL